MAIVTTKSQPIINRDAAPSVANNSSVEGGRLQEVVGTLESVSGDSIASKYILAQVPSNARISELLVYSDDIGTTTIADFGIYRNTLDGSAVVDADFFASAVSLKDGALNGVDITHESGVNGVEDIEKPLWEALGLSSDPNVIYDIVATLTAASDAAGTLSIKCKYAI